MLALPPQGMSVCQLMMAFVANLKQFRIMHSDDRETGEQKNSINVFDGVLWIQASLKISSSET
jgi:hypothetical protein